MSGSARVRGAKSIERAIKQWAKLCSDISADELERLVRDIGERSAKRAPTLTGALKRSLRVKRDKEGKFISAKLTFGSPAGGSTDYAIIQHERGDFQHPQGGEARFIQKTLNEMEAEIKARLAGALRDTLDGG